MSVQLTDCNCDYFNDYAATNNYTKNKDWFCRADSNRFWTTDFIGLTQGLTFSAQTSQLSKKWKKTSGIKVREYPSPTGSCIIVIMTVKPYLPQKFIYWEYFEIYSKFFARKEF